MHGSIYSRAVDAARAKATDLGHRLGKFDVIRTSAYAVCGTCGAGVAVLFRSPVTALGNAIETACESGKPQVAPPGTPAPSEGKAKHVHAPAPTFDDVPWPVDAPRRDTVVIR